MGKYATAECYNCHIRRPKIYLKQKKVSEKSGHIGWGVGFSKAKGRKRTTHLRFPRNRYSIKLKWVCANRNACGDLNYFKRSPDAYAPRHNKQSRLGSIFKTIMWVILIVIIIKLLAS